MSITQKALEDLADLVGFTVKRVEPRSQFFELQSECDTFKGCEYGRARSFMHLLWVAWGQGLTPEQVRAHVTWEPEITRLACGTRVYADVSIDASVDALVARYWKKPPPLDEEGE